MHEIIAMLVFLVIVILIIIITFYCGIKEWKRRKACTHEIKGTLVRKMYFPPRRRETAKYIFEFSYKFYGRNGGDFVREPIDKFGRKTYDMYKEGDIVTLYVNPDNPKDIRFKEVGRKYAFLIKPVMVLLFLVSFSWFPALMAAIQQGKDFFDYIPFIILLLQHIACLAWINLREV